MDEENYFTWAGDLYRKLEAVYVEAEDMMNQIPSGQEATGYLQETVQGVQQFLSGLIDDVLPSSPRGEWVDEEPLSGADLTDQDNSNIAVEGDQCKKELLNSSLAEAPEVPPSGLSSEPTSPKLCGKLESSIKGIEDDIKTEEIQCKTEFMFSMKTRENMCKDIDSSTTESLDGFHRSRLPDPRITCKSIRNIVNKSKEKYMKSLNKANPEENCSVADKTLLPPFPSYSRAFMSCKTKLIQNAPSLNLKLRKHPRTSCEKDEDFDAGSSKPKENTLDQSFLSIESQEQEFSDSEWEIL